ncbi:MAG TPA: protein-L-isoaspartate O-methyltransferase [Devosia sp.]|jgi:protein-L-isoaspartate(D-aspartate) O-methyltransferase|nr:protein-L-isoaspartate O-methyltransferase [Devosia sp.]
MADFERGRAQMVESQLRAEGVTDAPILARMGAIAREDFVAPGRRDFAYVDDIQWMDGRGHGRFLLPPVTLGKLIKLARVADSDSVLDVGSATGYSTAVIAGLAASAVGLERDARLSELAASNLARLGLNNVRTVKGGIESVASDRFDVIVVQGRLPAIPDGFFTLLKDSGRLVALVGAGAVAVATVYSKSGGRISVRSDFSASVPLLEQQADEAFVF